jgi:hypothetical protein
MLCWWNEQVVIEDVVLQNGSLESSYCKVEMKLWVSTLVQRYIVELCADMELTSSQHSVLRGLYIDILVDYEALDNLPPAL